MITTQNPPDLLRAAARNNADWCDAVCRTHGAAGVFGPDAWTTAVRTPPLYPDAVSLTPSAPVAGVLGGIDTGSPGCSVKDSFASLDLGPAGFEVLFEAQWIHRPAGPAPVGSGGAGPRWSRVSGPGELADWEAAWAGEEASGLFRPGLLSPDVVFLAGRSGGRIVAGAVLSTGGGVAGVSNLFAPDAAGTDSAWAAAVTTASGLWPALPLVGYEHGEDLDAAVRAGFAPVGPLRVWLHTA
ncbi:hypothetical protein ABZZ17_31385 [Streptomyces sp. NPDC006512]|uniref:hypothetical protein n=1 Tax=Streptomyces sp. NPDC006512 TaxID=3154307 RepID=UPI0033A491F2